MNLQEMTWPQVEKYFKENDLVLIPVGSCENHGTHLPLGTDTLIPQKIAEMIMAHRDVLHTPALPFGNCDYFSQFPGTISLGPKVLYDVLYRICDSLYTAGARRFIFLNGHGGNSAVIEEVCYAFSKLGALSAVINWWTMVGDFNPAWLGGHGGGQETAAILYIDPSLVDKEAMKEKDIKSLGPEFKPLSLKMVEFEKVKIPVPRDVGDICENGWFGPDKLEEASAEWGEAMLEETVRFLVRFIDEFSKADL